MSALRSAIGSPESARALGPEHLARLEVAGADFERARREVEPSIVREEAVAIAPARWQDVGGLEDVQRELREAVEWPLRWPGLLRDAGVRATRGVLLHGPPGTGKTLLVRALVAETGVNVVAVKGPALLSKYVGESERAVRDAFRKARLAAPCVLLFDEIDALAPARSDAGEDRVADRVVAQLLAELDGVEPGGGVLVVATTNRPDRLDPALLRPGRFDRRLEVPRPQAAARAAIFRAHLTGKPVAADVDAVALADATDGFSGAEIEDVCRSAALAAVRRALRAKEATGQAGLIVTRGDLLDAITDGRRRTASH